MRPSKMKQRVILLVCAVSILGLIVFLITLCVSTPKLTAATTVEEAYDNDGRPYFRLQIETDERNSVTFLSHFVNKKSYRYTVYSNDLNFGVCTIRFLVSRNNHNCLDSLRFENPYDRVHLEQVTTFDEIGNPIAVKIFTELGNRVSVLGMDTVLLEGQLDLAFNPDTILEGYDPDLNPTVLRSYQIFAQNSSGNLTMTTLRLRFSFQKVWMDVTDPYEYFISRTGSGYTIKGEADTWARIQISGAYSTSTTAGSNGHFSRWVSVPEFGENYYQIVASKEGMTSDTALVLINREMTEDEMITAYKQSCQQITAEYLVNNHNTLIGDDVRVWGRTIEYFQGSLLHLYNGDYHWIADLSGFDRVPNLVGLSFYCWGVVSDRNQTFYISGNNYVYAPVIEAVYTETSY
ncbi:MAG: hypothetical protein KAW14_14580 [Candidatus Aegiribacteria sp.]|nr:hypothetical protein [Candidatus Aegiribacteria sp.]